MVVIDAPTGEVLPGLFAVGFEGQAVELQSVQHGFELVAGDADGRLGEVRVVGMGDVEVVGDFVQRQVSGADAESG